MQSLGKILGKLEIPLSANTEGVCWCGGVGKPRPNRWNLEYCSCHAGQAQRDQDEQADRQRKLERGEAIWNKLSGIPTRFRAFKLSTSPLKRTMPALMQRLSSTKFPGVQDDGDFNDALVGEWIRTWEGSWYFWGGFGTGKTGIVVSMAREVIFGGQVVDGYGYPPYIKFVTVPDMLTRLRSTYSHQDRSEEDVLDDYRKPWGLILDDLGAEHVKGTGWVEDRLYQVIGYRHAEKKATWFTSNLSLQEIGERIGERIAWRIVEMCGPENIIEVVGPNIRDAKGARPRASGKV